MPEPSNPAPRFIDVPWYLEDIARLRALLADAHKALSYPTDRQLLLSVMERIEAEMADD